MPFKIRQMVPADLESVATLYEDANRFANHQAIFDWTQEGLEEFPQLNYVCDMEGQVVCGISGILVNKKTAEINDLTVLPSMRNRHIGGQLIETIVKRLREVGVERIHLWVHWKNARAIPFYHRHGFRLLKVGVTDGIEGVPDGEEIIYMEKRLK
jgi:ribosomal protein S18 acetylase RimI-like enzyme